MNKERQRKLDARKRRQGLYNGGTIVQGSVSKEILSKKNLAADVGKILYPTIKDLADKRGRGRPSKAKLNLQGLEKETVKGEEKRNDN